MKKQIIRIIGIVLVLLAISAGLGIFNKGADTTEPVKIGIALPLTGGAGFLGESAQNAALLALKDAGKTKYNYQLIIEDDAFTPSKTVTVANKFISIDKVLAFITFGSGTSNAVAPMNEDVKVARFGLASDPTSAIGEYNFIHWTPAYKEGELMAKEIINRGYKKVSIIDTNYSGTIAVTKAIRSGLESSDVKVGSYDVINFGDKDFRTMLSKIKQTNPDLIILENMTPEIELITKQIREMGMKDVPVTSVEAFEWSNQLELFEGMWFISDSIENDFVEHYKNEYGETPNAGSLYVYDLVSMLINLQEDSNKRIAPSELPSILMKKGYEDSRFFGKVMIDEDGNFVTEASVKKVENGQIVPMK